MCDASRPLSLFTLIVEPSLTLGAPFYHTWFYGDKLSVSSDHHTKLSVSINHHTKCCNASSLETPLGRNAISMKRRHMVALNAGTIWVCSEPPPSWGYAGVISFGNTLQFCKVSHQACAVQMSAIRGGQPKERLHIWQISMPHCTPAGKVILLSVCNLPGLQLFTADSRSCNFHGNWKIKLTIQKLCYPSQASKSMK